MFILCRGARTKRIIGIAAILIVLILIPMSTLKDSNAVQTTGTVKILGTCGLSFVSGTPINYGSLLPSATSADQILTLDNTGTASGTLSVSGSDWKDASGTIHILAHYTKYSSKTTTTPYASKIPLTAIPTVVGKISPSVNNATTWQLQSALINPPFSGTLTQTMDFTLAC